MIHALFSSIFYSLALVLLLIGVVTEYFKLPLGGMPQFLHLAGRFLVAAILLVSYPDVSNAIADFTDALSNQIGSLTTFKTFCSSYYDKIVQLHLSWTSIKDSILMLISFVTFFLLYISVYIADAAITYAWVILYVFSPLLIALYVLPSTAGATKALYRSLLEVGAWKIVWSVLATLLWSAALGQINQPESNINFITAVSFNLILAGSLLMTPFVVNALAGAGMASLAAQTAGIAAGAAFFSPGQLITSKVKQKLRKGDKDMEDSSDDRGPGGGSRPWSNFSERYGDDGFGINPSGGQRSAASSAVTQTKARNSTKGRVVTSSSRSQAQAVQMASQSDVASVVGPAAAPVVAASMISSKQRDSRSTVSFKSAATSYQPPVNRSEYQRKPVQQALFNELRDPDKTQK
jgi:hypothetical protein